MASILFHWDHNDPQPETVSFNLYENDVLVVPNIGEMNFSLLMDGKDDGEYRYSVTAVRFGRESQKSEEWVANFTVPNPPIGFRGSWVL